MNEEEIRAAAITELVNAAFRSADMMMREHGQAALTFVGYARGGRQFGFRPYVEDPEKRNVLMQAAFAAYDIVVFSAASEAWVLKGNARDGMPTLRPSQSERRIEMLWAVAGDGQTLRMRSAVIERADDGSYAGYSGDEMLDGEGAGGAFATLNADLHALELSSWRRRALREQLRKDFIRPGLLVVVDITAEAAQ